jgi:transposase
MSLYGGIDLHANNSVIVLLNEQDEVIYQKRLPNALPTILEQLAPYHTEMQGVVVESTYNWYWRFCRKFCSGGHEGAVTPVCAGA